MDALILAAGFGRRLRAFSECKPLTPVLGVPLIEWAARGAARAGVERIVVTTGYLGERLEEALPAIAGRVGVPVQACRVPDFALPNGYSVMAGARLIAGDYLLMMADHILSWRILERLARAGAADRGVTLAIDRQIDSSLVDPDDATWVERSADGRIRAIGKHLHHYDAVDCGAFLATSELAGAIAAAVAGGRPGSLSDGMQVLAHAGRAATLDVTGEWWIDIDDAKYHALAEDLLKSRLDDGRASCEPAGRCA